MTKATFHLALAIDLDPIDEHAHGKVCVVLSRWLDAFPKGPPGPTGRFHYEVKAGSRSLICGHVAEPGRCVPGRPETGCNNYCNARPGEPMPDHPAPSGEAWKATLTWESKRAEEPS
jgi:hypothetical protein